MGMIVREFAAEDRDSVRRMLVDCQAFSEEEVRIALDMVEAGLQGDYSLLVVEADGQVQGYACLGRAPLTASAWYLYWICVTPAGQGRGAGRMLQAGAEQLVRAAGGDRIVIETSGRPDYERTRRFYRNAGFAEVGRIPDFYKPADDCMVFCKVLNGGGAT